ncbi:DUF3408 domain-containing protein [Chryseobacterium indologenes]|uniref:DUF3408 domain-containing protein n=1 Tax=Chryseobacterium TaxID=59732 RepID=UPI0023E7F2F8|nr:DUF3408 domain-containing protein [Chryseobacterium indologenes]WET50746.1 DUF3408 domain-containing protein [Chryseobacterium indologenes]
MEDQKKMKSGQEINEYEMMNLMVDGVRKEGLYSSQSLKDETLEQNISKNTGNLTSSSKDSKPKPKKSMEMNYDQIFFKKRDTNARDGKTVYIRPEFHEKLSRIIQVIGEDKISIYAYLDNLLEHHFQEFAEQIVKSYNEKHKPIM